MAPKQEKEASYSRAEFDDFLQQTQLCGISKARQKVSLIFIMLITPNDDMWPTLSSFLL